MTWTTALKSCNLTWYKETKETKIVTCLSSNNQFMQIKMVFTFFIMSFWYSQPEPATHGGLSF